MSRNVLIVAAGIVGGANLYYLYKKYYRKPKPDNGLYIEFYNNFRKKLECSYKDKKLMGSYKEWYPSGSIKLQCTYDDDRLDGLYESYYDNSCKERACTYQKGKLIGLYTTYYSNGNKSEEYRYNEYEQRDGLDTQYYSNGNKKRETRYIRGNENGLCQTWYENGKMEMECTYVDNNHDGQYTFWSENGNLYTKLTYKNGILDGMYETHYSGGECEHGYYIAGEKYITQYWKCGKLYQQCVYEDRKVKQLINYGHDSRTVKICENGLQVKLEKYYKEKKVCDYGMLNGAYHGNFVHYTDSDNFYNNDARIECSYNYGKLHGEYISYNAKGDIDLKVVYDNGNITSVVSYKDKDGRECVLEDGEITVWKACRADVENVYVELSVPVDAKRITTTRNYKARVEHARVVSIKDKDGNSYVKAHSFVNYRDLEYVVGQMVYPNRFCSDMMKDCAEGINVHRYRDHCDQWFKK